MRAKTRPNILEAARSVLTRNPDAPVHEVADAAGISRATFYRYFPSRDDLIRELTQAAWLDLDTALNEVLSENTRGEGKLLALCEAMVPLGDRFIYVLQEQSIESETKIEFLLKFGGLKIASFIEELKAEGLVRTDIHSIWIRSVFYSLIYTAWLRIQNGSISQQEAPKLVYQTLLKGFGS
jgi:TetR/AcrR family transcriptional repressor of mexCD-oprJ operon